MAETKSYPEVIRENFRRIRREKFGRQEDLAEAANELGLDWTQTTVAGIETGRRRITEEEWLLLQYLISPREVRRYDGPVRLNDRVVLPPEHYQAAIGMFSPPRVIPRSFTQALEAMRERAAPVGRKAEARMARKFAVTLESLDTLARRLWSRGLTAERDRRLDQQPGDGDHRMRAAWITRQLEQELRDYLAKLVGEAHAAGVGVWTYLDLLERDEKGSG